jgi:MFS family permease
VSTADAIRAPLDMAAAKVARRVVPLFVIMLICNQLDRGNVAYAQQHLEADVGIGAAAYGLGAGLFFIGYALFEVPSNMLMERFGPKVWLTRIMLTWGLVSAAMALAVNEALFYLLRFLLGVAEAGFFPAVIFYFTRWLPHARRSQAVALFIMGSSIAAALSGPLSGPLLSLDEVGGLQGWQWLFLVEGLLSVVVGAFAYFRLDARIDTVEWLEPAEREALQQAIAEEDAERVKAAARHGEGDSWWRMLVNPTVLVASLIFFSCTMAIYTTTFWLPPTLHDIPGTTDITVGLLAAIPWVGAIFAAYFSARAADRAGTHRRWLFGALLVGSLASMGSAFAGTWTALALIAVATMGFKAATAVFWAVPQRRIHPSVMAAAIAVINSLGNLGGFVAPYGFGLVKQETGTISAGLFALSVFGLLAATLVSYFRERPGQTGDTEAPRAEPRPENAV